MSYTPEWVETLRRKYYSRNVCQFILHGNVNDFVRVSDNEQADYLKLNHYLMNELFKKRDIVVCYDRANGISFSHPDMRKDFINSLSAYDTLHGTNFAKSLPKDPTRAFAILENYIRIRLNDKKRIALIIEYAETIAPASTMAYSNAEDRAIQVYLLRWAKDALFLESDFTLLMITENIGEMNQAIVRNPYASEIEIAYPDETERLHFIYFMTRKYPKLIELLEMTPELLAKHTAGVNLVHLKTLLLEILENNIRFTHKDLMKKKETIIEAEANGLLEFVKTKYNLDYVAGHKYAKQHLREAAAAIKNGRGDVLPMGYLVNGPVGTGKTFLVSCFAADIGIPMVLLKNFRSQWQGVTESNLERVLRLLKAMNPVAVMIDEADAYLGNRNAQGDSGVSSRVFSMIASFMSNTEHRGKIIWFLLTARPDLMPVDLKRQGRAEEHIALFYPETVEEKKELFEVMLKKVNIQEVTVNDFDDVFYQNLKIVSGADMEAALTRSKFKAASKGLQQVTKEIIQQTLNDFIPPTYPEEVELMNYVAVLECTSKELLPERFRILSRDEIINRVEELKKFKVRS